MFLCMALGRFSFATMIPALVESGDITAVRAGYIGGINLCGFLLGAAASVQLARRFGVRRTLLFSVWSAALALFACILPAGGYWLGLWRFTAGVCTGVVMVQSLSLAITLAPPEKRAQAAGFVFAGVGFGILFSGAVVPHLLSFGITAAWTGVAVAGLLAALLVTVALILSLPNGAVDNSAVQSPPQSLPWYLLVTASVIFSFGIVPHTIYWFDFIAREMAHGDAVAGYHWMLIGVAGIAGPLAAAWLAAVCGTRVAAVVGFLLLALGVGLPVLLQQPAVLWLSTLLFGLQPAVSGLIAARVRDIGSAVQALAMMRVVILANGVGAAVGGVVYPFLYGVGAGYWVLFFFASGGFFLGALCFPRRG